MTLKDLRKRAKLTQKELAKKLGYEQTIVSMWENGTREPNNQTLIDLSQIFDCSVDELLGCHSIQQKQPEQIEPEEELTKEQKECVKILKTLPPKQVEQTYYFLLGLSERSLEIMKRE